MSRALSVFVLLALLIAPVASSGQPLLKSAVQVDAGSTKQTGQTFGYRLTYSCSSTSGPCLGAEVVDLLPAEVQYVSTVPASPSGDVAAINVTANFMGSGRTRVQFVLINPLPAGNSGDLLVNVRFPAGTTPNGTQAMNTADGINLETTPGTFTTPPVTVTAVATVQVNLSKSLLTSPANLDLPEQYRLRINVPNSAGALGLTAIGPVTDTLPPGTVFNGATPAADCEPGCVGTTPATVTWTAPCSVPLNPNSSCDVLVNVVFPSATFTSGQNVTNSFVTDATPLGEPAQTFGPGTVTHPVTTFVPAPGMGLAKNLVGGTPNPPTLNQAFSYELVPSNSGNVDLDGLEMIDDLPVALAVTSVTTGAYNNLSDFAAGVGVEVSYEKNTVPGVFTLWGSSPAAGTNATLTPPVPGLGAGEYLTRLRWRFGTAQPGMQASSTGNRPRITGQVINPDNAGGPVAFGDTIQNCVSSSAVYTAGPTNVTRGPVCRSFILSGPFVQLNPGKQRLTGGGPFAPGASISWRLQVRSASQSSDPLPLEDLTVADLLPVDLIYTAASWTFNANGTGLPAPQTFDEVPNFAGTGRTLLRWRWLAGSGSLAPNAEVRIDFATTIRNGAAAGTLSNTLSMQHDSPGLAQRCSGTSAADTLDFDGDADTAETRCVASQSADVAPIAQVVSSKQLRAICDGDFTSLTDGSLVGGLVEYKLRVQNVGTVPMQNFVVIDILPFVGDTGVRDTNPRGSQWTPLLVAPITPPPGTVLYYSTSGNPCRGEVGGPVTGCDPPGWTTVAPDPISSARSFKVEFLDRVLDPFDDLTFNFRLMTPGDTPAGVFAYNSFAYQGDRADGLGALAAEPQKVGVELGVCEAAALGDYVWIDGNGNGVQDDGPTGLNGVYVELWSPGDDGSFGTLDDTLEGGTITTPSPLGQPGWYQFPGLVPATYRVCFHPPPTYAVTAPLQGGDGSLDSDADLVTACTAPVTLAADEVNPDLDLGLLPPDPAALGDYVWFDRNGDGVQNESTFDGLNGVTVRLWVDDGDGVPEPGGGDFLVATRVTADDVYGRPGYYLFDGLVPGVPYFVQVLLPPVATGFTSQDAGGDDSEDSDVAAVTGATPVVTLAGGEFNPTLDAGLVLPAGSLGLGNQVWHDLDNDGVFEPEAGELGLDGVDLRLYRDANLDGQPQADEYFGATATFTSAGFAGRYRFDGLAAGDYLVVVDNGNFGGSAALGGLVTSTGNDPAPDPDDDVDGDDNGSHLGTPIASQPVTLSAGAEPTSEDGDADTNLTVDFGFIDGVAAPTQWFDYGDAPDQVVGTTTGDYSTIALDSGPHHRLGMPNAPYLGSCVDADSGFIEGPTATGDDVAGAAFVTGSCGPGGDEDGVVLSSPMVPGDPATVEVTGSIDTTDCMLNAWIDWNRNGIFGDLASEVIADDLAVSGGSATVINLTVPATAVPGLTYGRFRCSSAGGLGPTGLAPDGEVEDYRIPVAGDDFGDAPASYGTSGAGAASHRVDATTPRFLGACVDTEADGQPSVAADGDNTGLGTSQTGAVGCLDDEDGITFLTPLVACAGAQIAAQVRTPGTSVLDAWIDFGADGSFDAGDQVIAGQSLATGTHVLGFAVPCGAVTGTSYARFRLSSTGSGATGAAPDGEVEDYALVLGGVDFGDAPDSYGTLFASGGPHHAAIPGFSLGATEDVEAEGQPSAGATGDGSDEDGVTLATLEACQATTVPVVLTNTAGMTSAVLDAWIDWDADGAFNDPRDRVASGLALIAGSNNVPVSVPCDAGSVATYARFRLSSAGVAGPGGFAADGEVEDYALDVLGFDFGDAPAPFATQLAANGARHRVLLAGNPVLGSVVDTEADGQPNAALAGDDANGVPDDEDGVVFPAVLIPGTQGSVEVTTATGGQLWAWIDFDADGSWGGAGEQIAAGVLLPATTSTLTFPVPVGSPSGQRASRFRLIAAGGGPLTPTGAATEGEVEDHPVPMGVEEPALGAGTCLISVERFGAEQLATLDVTLGNYGNVPLADVNATVDLATTFAAALGWSVESLTSADFTVNPGYDGSGDLQLLAAGNTLPVAGQGTVRLVVRVSPGNNKGPYDLEAQGEGTSPAGVLVTDASQDGCDPDPNGDGDPGNDDEPTPIIFIVSVLEIPTLGPWGLLLLAGLLAASALPRLRRAGGRLPRR